MTKETLTLNALPIELILNISTYLNASSVISLAKSCRTCYHVAYDTQVFRHVLEGSNASWESDWVSESVNLKDIVKRRGDDAAVLARYKIFTSSRRNLWGKDDELSSTLRRQLGRSRDGWIKYAVADDKAFATFNKLDDLLEDQRKARQAHASVNLDQMLEYLPQLVVLKHPCLHSPSTVPLLMSHIEAAKDNEIDPRLAFAFCGSILSQSGPLEAVSSDSSAARRRLERFAYHRMAVIHRKLKSSQDGHMSQTDGHMMLGSVSALLRLAFRNYRVQHLIGAEYYTFLVPFLFDLPIFQEDSFSKMPLPLEGANGDDRTFDGYLATHVKSMIKELNGTEWVGCYSYSKQSIEFESPTRNLRWRVTPAKAKGQYSVVATASDHVGDFAFTGTAYDDGNLHLRKTYMGGSSWDYTGVMTPFGIAGIWGNVGLKTVGGAFWLWKSEWTA